MITIGEKYYTHSLGLTQENISNILNKLYVLDVSSNPYPWDKKQWQQINDIQYKIFLLRYNNTHSANNVIGFSVWLNIDNNTIELLNIVVDKAYQGQKLGSLWLNSLCKELACYNLWLEVRKSNLIAQKLYTKCGFIVNGSRKNYYPIYDTQQVNLIIAKEDALLMSKYLTKFEFNN